MAPNKIAESQNADHNLRRLAAMGVQYSEAKRLQAVLIVISTFAVVAWAILILWLPSARPYGALWACVATLLDVLLLTPLIKDKKSRAARIQEEFDCEVLALPWCQCKVGDRPEPETVGSVPDDRAAATSRDWYPSVVQSLPLHLARLVCQRASCWWERDLRQKYQQYSAALVAVAILTIIVAGMAAGVSLQNAVLVVLLIQPSLILLVRNAKEHRDAADNADRLRKIADGLWHRSLSRTISAEEAGAESRLLQNEIFDHRVRSPLVFNWFYRLHRKSQEAQMQGGAKQLVEQYLRASG